MKKADYWESVEGVSNKLGMDVEDIDIKSVCNKADVLGIDITLEGLMNHMGVNTFGEFTNGLIKLGMAELLKNHMFKQTWASLNYNYEKKNELFKENTILFNEVQRLQRIIKEGF